MKALSFDISPRFYETDAAGHVNNVAIVGWFEVLRTRYLESVGLGPEELANWVLASLTVDFLRETQYERLVTASVADATVGNSSLTLKCELSQAEIVRVKGEAVVVHLGSERTPEEIPRSVAMCIGSREQT